MNSILHSSSALETGAAVAGPVKIDEIIVHNTGAADAFLQIFDASSVPADTTVPLIVIKVTAGNTISYDPETKPAFSTGCAVCLSTTVATKTVILANEGFFTIRGE